ncbi:MAG: PLP-dependent aminotransferase family protein [Bacteriovoracaceae bacterium]|nr:PLP-dependent aminotransferase family protein [Bacteriovoracaceae bacterium]
MFDLSKNTSITSRRIKGSVIRELLKLTNNPDIISLAGGLPSPESFPTEDIAAAAQKVLKERPHEALQYGTTEGFPELKREIIKLMEKDGFKGLTEEHVLVTSSSQQGLDLVGRLFIDPTDPVLVELPTYLGALQAFSAYGAQFIGVKSDGKGIDFDDLKMQLTALRHSDEHYKFIYCVPDFQNPSGITWNQEKRESLVKLAKEYGLIVIDDSPYRELRFEGDKPEALGAMDIDNVITLRSFSKIFAPGLRLGWIIANPEIIKQLSKCKQSTDLCANSLGQLIASEYLQTGKLEGHIKYICEMYKAKRDVMLNALEKYMPEGVTWTRPEGGLFLWVTLPEHISADDMFREAVDKKVAYVIGSAFHCNNTGLNTMRLNFSFPNHEQLDEGVRRLAETIKSKGDGPQRRMATPEAIR